MGEVQAKWHSHSAKVTRKVALSTFQVLPRRVFGFGKCLPGFWTPTRPASRHFPLPRPIFPGLSVSTVCIALLLPPPMPLMKTLLSPFRLLHHRHMSPWLNASSADSFPISQRFSLSQPAPTFPFPTPLQRPFREVHFSHSGHSRHLAVDISIGVLQLIFIWPTQWNANVGKARGGTKDLGKSVGVITLLEFRPFNYIVRSQHNSPTALPQTIHFESLFKSK